MNCVLSILMNQFEDYLNKGLCSADCFSLCEFLENYSFGMFAILLLSGLQFMSSFLSKVKLNCKKLQPFIKTNKSSMFNE